MRFVSAIARFVGAIARLARGAMWLARRSHGLAFRAMRLAKSSARLARRAQRCANRAEGVAKRFKGLTRAADRFPRVKRGLFCVAGRWVFRCGRMNAIAMGSRRQAGRYCGVMGFTTEARRRRVVERGVLAEPCDPWSRDGLAGTFCPALGCSVAGANIARSTGAWGSRGVKRSQSFAGVGCVTRRSGMSAGLKSVRASDCVAANAKRHRHARDSSGRL